MVYLKPEDISSIFTVSCMLQYKRKIFFLDLEISPNKTFHSFNNKYIGSSQSKTSSSSFLFFSNCIFRKCPLQLPPNWPSLSLRVIMHASFHLKSESHTHKRLTVAGNLRSKQFQKLFLSSTTTLVSQNSSDKRAMPTPLLKSAS